MLLEDAYLFALVSALPDPVVGVDADGRIRAWNALASTAFGYGEEEAYGMPLRDLIGDGDAPRRLVRTKDGGVVSVTTEAIAIGKAGRPNGVVTLLVLRPGTDDESLQLDNLPPRLRQTLDGLCDGLAEKEIAAKLGLSAHTVHGYVKALYRKWGVQSRGALMARAVVHSLHRERLRTGS